jgi:hypothetical protein
MLPACCVGSTAGSSTTTRCTSAKALGYCSPREFREQFVGETTENAVGVSLPE